jgi:hypothetical protein
MLQAYGLFQARVATVSDLHIDQALGRIRSVEIRSACKSPGEVIVQVNEKRPKQPLPVTSGGTSNNEEHHRASLLPAACCKMGI